MDTKKNLLAFFLIGLVIILTPYYLALFEPLPKKTIQKTKAPSEIISSSSSSSDYNKNIIINPDSEAQEKIVYIETDKYIAGVSNISGG